VSPASEPPYLNLKPLLASLELHLQEYFRDKHAYLQVFERRQPSIFCPLKLQAFSDPESVNGYDMRSISDEMVTETYLEYNNKTRKLESEAYLRTRTGEWDDLMIGAIGSATIGSHVHLTRQQLQDCRQGDCGHKQECEPCEAVERRDSERDQ
jgi:hypothetical protein